MFCFVEGQDDEIFFKHISFIASLRNWDMTYILEY